jgi:hypothetical protein
MCEGCDERAAGLQSDAVLFEQLLATRFTGPAWRTAAQSIGSYCLEVMRAWLHTKEVFAQCAEKGFQLPRASLPLNATEISDLAADTVTDALNNFRLRALAGKGWRPDGGRSLASWVMGDCVFAFPNVWRRWLSRCSAGTRVEAQELLVAHWPDASRWVTGSTEDLIVRRDEAQQALTLAGPRLRKAIVLLALGYSQAETCEILGDALTPRALEGHLYRFRRQLQTRKEA